jgi:hypothetical protein
MKLFATRIVFLSMFVLLPSRSDACSCMGGIPLCQSLWTTGAVFSGQVVGIEEVPEKTGSVFMRRNVTLRVLDVFRGTVGSTVEVITGLGGGDCGYAFQKGEQYLVYASANAAGALSTGICSPTKTLATAAQDIAYLNQVRSRPSAAGRIFGNVQYQRDPDAPPGIGGAGIAGYTVTLSDGQRTRAAITGADGGYAFDGIPAGNYVVSLQLPPTEDAGGPHTASLADPRGCAVANFYVWPDGRMRVRLVDHAGRPKPGVRIDILNLDAGSDAETAWWPHSFETDEQGWAELRELRPRRYLLAVNGQYPPTSKTPYPTTYFPGVTAREQATTISLGLGERVELGDWVLPVSLLERRITGVVQWADGRPAAGAHVLVDASKTGGWRYWMAAGNVSATTDAEGRFSITLLDGVPYEVFAYGEVGERRVQVRTPRVELTPSEGTRPLKLVIPR